MSAAIAKPTAPSPNAGPTGAVRPEGVGRGAEGKATSAASSIGGEDFRQALDQAFGPLAPAGAQPGAPAPLAAPAAAQLKFSQHAIDRMRSRGIAFTPEQMKGIEGAVAKAAQKGSKDTLVLAGDGALIVSVKNNTVVTVMDKSAMRENVFTNIDSTVVI